MKFASVRLFGMAASLAALALPAQATTTTTLTFTEIIDAATTLNYSGTAGGNLTVSSTGGKLVIVLGELGVAKLANVDTRLGSGETITFSFAQAVSLSYWDLDDLPFGSNQFGLSVDGGTPASYSLASHGSATPLIGNTFTFSYTGDSYFIDTLKFSSVTAVPEASSTAMVLAGLGVVGFIAGRRRRG